MRANRFQQVVLVVGLGLGLWYLGGYITSLGAPSGLGWVAYAPLSRAVDVPHADLTSLGQLLVRVGVTAAWVVLSWLILRDRGQARV